MCYLYPRQKDRKIERDKLLFIRSFGFAFQLHCTCLANIIFYSSRCVYSCAATEMLTISGEFLVSPCKVYVRLNEICDGSFLVRTKLKTSLKFMVQMPIAERALSFTKCYRRPSLPYLLRSLNISVYTCVCVCVLVKSGVRCVSVHILGFKLLECNASSGSICIIKCSSFFLCQVYYSCTRFRISEIVILNLIA